MNISKGKVQKPPRVVIYGGPGVGKSVFTSKLPNAFHIDIEDSTNQLDVVRNADPINSWAMLNNYVKDFKNEHKVHGFEFLVVDTIDWAERLAADEACAKNNWTNIEQLKYGAGWRSVHDMFGKFLDSLSDLTNQGVTPVLLAHSTIKQQNLPDQDGAYDKYKMKLQKTICAYVEEWADVMLFMNFKTNIVKDEKSNKLKGQGSRRVIYTEPTAAFEAKNRFDLPHEIDITQSMTGEDNPNLQKIISIFSIDKPAKQEKPKEVPQQKALGDELDEMEAKEAMESNQEQEKTFDLGVMEPNQLHGKLRTLMESNQVHESEIRWAQSNGNGGAGYLPVDMPLENYPDDLVEGVLVGAWDKIFPYILSARQEGAIKFSAASYEDS